jgi:hypothetical protein
VITRLDAHEYVPSQAATPAQPNTAAATQSPASEVDDSPAPARRPAQDRPAQPRELLSDWSWQSDLDDQQPRPSDAKGDSTSTKDQTHSGLRLGSHFDRLSRDVDGYITYDRKAVGPRIIRVRQVILTGRR